MCILNTLIVTDWLEQYSALRVKSLKKMTTFFQEERFLGEDPVTAFINVITLISDFISFWGFIESQVKNIKEKKKRVDDDEDKEDCSSAIKSLQSKMKDLSKGMKRMRNEVICRLDAVHLKSSSYDRECLLYIRPYQTSTTATTLDTKPRK